MMRVTKDDVRKAYKYYGLFNTRDRVIAAEYILKTEDPAEAVICYDFVDEVWSCMERDSFFELLHSENRSGELSEEQEVHALWYLEQAHAFNGEGDDEAVKALLQKWTEKKEEYWEAFKPGWFAKYVETRFYLKGKQYTITPDSIGLEQGEPWDEGLMEYLQGEIGEDLKKLGATEICHLGFLD